MCVTTVRSTPTFPGYKARYRSFPELSVSQSVLQLYYYFAHLFCRCTGCPSSACVQREEGRRSSYTAAEFDTRSVRGFLFIYFSHLDYNRYRISRRAFRTDVKHIVYLQSCIRRRLARKELKNLKAEARSVSKFKEISYKLENKVVELTQTLQKRTQEKKSLQAQLSELERQLQQWVNRHDESDARAKQLQIAVSIAETEISRRDELLKAKADVERRLEDAVTKAAEKEETILKLTEDLMRQATQLEMQQKAIDSTPVRTTEDGSVILTLKNEVSSLREQLNRANALNALTKGSRMDAPTSPTFAPALRGAENGDAIAHDAALAPYNRHQRRHSSAGVYALAPSDHPPLQTKY